jgi:hypothetical protein
MNSSSPVSPKRVFIVRSRSEYQVVPGTYFTAGAELVRFRNLTDAEVELQNGRLPAFPRGNVCLAPGAELDVPVTMDPGVYEYEVQVGGEGGFFAVGNSSPRMIVDP